MSAGSLAGKVAIITGAARGQGAAEARLFAAEGARLVLTDIAIDEVPGEGGGAVIMHHDVSQEDHWAAVIEAAMSRFGRIDVLVNNAGIYQPCTTQDTDRTMFERFFAINQLGTFLGMRAVIPAMIEGGGGSIVNIASTAGSRGVPGMFAYATSKWAVRGMSKCAALDLAKHDIRVNAILPGAIDTPMLAENPPEVIEWMRSAIPLGRLGTAEDVAGTAAFLATDAARYISGAEISVCGAAFA